MTGSFCPAVLVLACDLVDCVGFLAGAADACRDRLGRFVTVGAYFVPDDPCRTCLCDGGTAVACAVMQCSQPECDHFQRIEGECCSVKCIQMPANKSKSTVTGFSGMYRLHRIVYNNIIICCLIIIIHEHFDQ